MQSPSGDQDAVVGYYRTLYEQYGHSPRALGWNKGRQPIRFAVLLSEFLDLKAPRVLDVGCGFGDLANTLERQFGEFSYVGVDLTPEMIAVAENAHCHQQHVTFECGDFLHLEFDTKFDIVVASGTFNIKLPSGRNRQLIEAAFSKAFDLCTEGISFDFLSSYVEFEHDHTFHSSPEDILSLAYSHTHNIVLKNNYMPFEFCVTAFKNDAFCASRPVFDRFLRQKKSLLCDADRE